MVELRKRPAPAPAAEPAKKKAAPKSKAKKDDAKTAEVVPEEQPSTTDNADASKEVITKTKPKVSSGPASPPKKGDQIDLETFGGEIETNSEQTVTLASLVENSKKGVVLFTYPKASTPGCTTQVCLFRDSYEPLTATGLAIYGLSTDSPKANLNFKQKQKLPYTLLCDPRATLIQAIGFKKAPKGTQRGVFVVDKEGKVLAVEAGGPAATVEVVKKLVESMGGDAEDDGLKKAEQTAEKGEEKEVGDEKAADTAAEVADVAKELDETPA